MVDKADLKSSAHFGRAGSSPARGTNQSNKLMRKNLILSVSVLTVSLLGVSCSGKMGALSSDYFTVTPNPLESQAGKVPASIAGSFPEKYLKKNAVVTVIPELRYGNGESTQGEGATFQGEKVTGNDQTISYRLGGRYTMKTNFTYVPEMQKSEMYLTFKAKVGKKTVNIPAVKVADGVVATSELYKKTILSDGGCLAPDSFQRVTQQKQEANIKFLVNQANIRKSELQSNSVKDFVEMLRKINADKERLNIQNVEIQAYASPEGGYDFNNKLSAKRQNVTEGYVNEQLKATKVEAGIDAHYTAQDWDGFKQLVAVSNIQDKDVIIRVLEMYKDPEEREKQIRNMSAGFQELAQGILPELRRSRMIINYETIGRSDEEILKQYNDDASALSVEELLYAATLVETNEEKTAIYKKTASLYKNDARAVNNLASMSMLDGDTDAAEQYISKAISIDPKQAQAYANRGLLNLVNGDVEAAETDIAKATTLGDVRYAQGVLNIAKGNYKNAESNFKGESTNSAALAQILNKNYAQAVGTLDEAANKNATNTYLHAIAAARRENKYAAKSYLKEALEQDPSLESYAANDYELAITRE
jgi:Flp pilus assembly protein TadD/outer membrane protein OmpA-like peptidoglycan-associated protein